MAKAIIAEVYTDHLDRYHVVYASGKKRLYNSKSDLPGTVRAWLEAHKDPDPELKKIQDSMTESFYEFCTGEKAPENWKEIVKAERGKVDNPAEMPLRTHNEPQERVEDSNSYKSLPTTENGEFKPIIAYRSPRASEAVMMGLCMTIAVAWFVTKELLIIVMLAVRNLAAHMWEHREEALQAVCQVCQAVAKSIAKFAIVRNRKAALALIRMIPVAVGLACLM